ncbi:MAG: hypothetical protein C0410_12065 [Anaerolinea sp.]|nr:hypothetical protein [Anaerolinea sp.]
MPFTWKDFLAFAENIYASPETPGPREAALRSAASRAYYAAFQAALELGKNSGYLPTHTGEDHHKIREHYRKFTPPQENAKIISLQLDRLYDLRRQADYDNLLKQKPEYLAYNAISMAKIVFKCLDEIFRV